MKLVAKMLGIVVIGGALSTAACGKKDAPAPAEGAQAVAVENAASTAKADEPKADEPKADEAKDEAKVATAPAGEVAAAKAGGEADCPFHEDKGEAAGGCDHDKVAKADGEADCPFHEDKGEAAGGCDHDKVAQADEAAGHEAMGCDHAAMAAADAPKGEGDAHFGADFTLTEAKPLASVVAAVGDGNDDVVQVSGTIHQVCQAAGCWMVVKDGDAEARVVMKGHAFTVPKDSKGKPTVVEGTMKVRTFTEAQAKHLAEDAGKDPATVTGETKEYVVTASAITIKG